MTPKPRTAEYFDGWYADKSATPQVAEIMNRNLGLPPDAIAGSVPGSAIDEIADGLRLKPGGVLLDLACGRGWYGLEIAARAGARLIGVDFSAEAVRQAADQAGRLDRDAEFRTGELTASGLPDGSVNAVLCTDSIQFPEQPADAYRELRRVLVPGGRAALTSWEPVLAGDERLPERMQRVDLDAGLRAAGFIDVEVVDRPDWLALEHAMWREAVALDPSADPALRSFHGEGVRSLANATALRRVLATATAP
ncbi:MAG TPA: class I SAM-dependent methyltransferase [Trebonia sp.]|jgi:SAM-dependent methyltransferase